MAGRAVRYVNLVLKKQAVQSAGTFRYAPVKDETVCKTKKLKIQVKGIEENRNGGVLFQKTYRHAYRFVHGERCLHGR